MRRRDIPGLAAAVVRNGRIVAAGAYGLAAIVGTRRIDFETLFPIASLDKQLTASAVMLLVEDGKVRLDDPIGAYIRDAPASWAAIRLRHLLSHTSGLPDVVFEGRPAPTHTTADLLQTVKRQHLRFPPGTDYLYSDAGLFLCQLVIEQVSRQPWRQFMTERIFRPAGMNAIEFLDPQSAIATRVTGYERLAGGRLVPNSRYEVDFGPLYNDVGATVLDFGRWVASLQNARVLPAALRDQMWTAATRADDTLYWRDYGFGWGLDRYRGIRVAIHSGFTGVGIAVLPDRSTAAVVFTNLDNRFGSDAHGLALGLVGAYEPAVSLVGMPTKPDSDAALTERCRTAFRRIVANDPDDGAYSPSLVASIREGARSFESRAPSLGALQSFTFLTDEPSDDGLVRYYEARFANGRLFVRIVMDAKRRTILSLQAIHV
jgi:CubicO group peptidase (beta-lactamase class C family)